MDDEQASPPPCDPDAGCCPPGGASRREFFQVIGLGALAAMAPRPIVAGPFEAGDFAKLVPADKKLSAEWMRSLTERGTPTASRGAELEKIGMPVGGIGVGQLHLGGDGSLWHWDIFNLPHATGDAHYASPQKPDSPLDPGFALRITADGKTQVRPLDRRGFSGITFVGRYPIGR